MVNATLACQTVYLSLVPLVSLAIQVAENAQEQQQLNVQPAILAIISGLQITPA
mgnify:CR=1 FL=1